MAWSVSRKATDEDYVRVNAAALRFIQRHGSETIEDTGRTVAEEWKFAQETGQGAESFLNDLLSAGYGDSEFRQRQIAYWEKLLTASMRRALHGDGDGIAHGYVGHSVE
jgi:hypothetical protein